MTESIRSAESAARQAAKTERYKTLGFTEEANLDEGHLWPKLSERSVI